MSAAGHQHQIDESRYGRLLARVRPRPIHSEADNRRMTELLLKLDERENLTPEEEHLAEMLTVLIEDFEARRYPLVPVPPYEALKALMEDRGLRHRDIWPVLGNKGVASEIPQRQTVHQQSAGKEAGGILPSSC